VGLRLLDQLGDVAGRRVFVRADLNVPIADGVVADDSRIRASVSTLSELRDRGADLVLASHLGRPKGAVDEALRLAPVGDVLGALLDHEVMCVRDVTPEVLPGAPIVLLENLRFDPGEEANDPAFAGRLAELADAYVDDAFGAVHRAHASVSALPDLMHASGRPAVAGRLVEREVDVLTRLLHAPDRPFVAILGGAKVSDKLAVIDSLLERVDVLLVGGAMAFTLLAAQGARVGRSLVEPARFDEIRRTLAEARDRNVEVALPLDVVAAPAIDSEDGVVVSATDIAKDLAGFDIGPATVAAFREHLAHARTVLWNGPMGVFEREPFAAGTRGVAEAIAASPAFSVVGGGDSLAAVHGAGLDAAFDHLSTGGGASLAFLEGRALPGLSVLEDDQP